ncbi:MAG: amidohydrolase family protein, partial [Rhodopirellula sp. JB044]|uniref:amidohydrolase family protein n=1 Tax=Rhodopirellula sp. JB044 TaxID=3342844 RepID=UPI00370BC255
VPGNIASTLATIKAADGYPIHLTHAQFHCYGTEGPFKFSSAASQLVEAMQRHPNVTIDVGQIQFGQTVTISADAMHQYDNIKHASPRKSVLVDIDCEAGCGVVPFRYRRRQFVHSLQWAIGLELFLMVNDPARVFLTTDHPNGGPFTAYPHLLAMLSDRTLRDTALSEIDADAAASSSLKGIDRQYSLDDIATMTRAAPAKILGLHDRGSLAPGRIADVVVYRTQDQIEPMFRTPEMVFKSGKLIRKKGDSCNSSDNTSPDRTLAADVHQHGFEFGRNEVAQFRARYSENGTIEMDRLWITEEEMETVLGNRLHPTGMRTSSGEGSS